MPGRPIITVLLACFLLTAGVASCDFITGATTAAKDIPVIIEPTTDVEEPDRDVETPGIVFENMALEEGRLDRTYHLYPGIPDSVPTRINDPCYYLRGTIRNEYGQRYWVVFSALGFDELGNAVSFTLDTGPIHGVEQIAIEPGDSENFTLHLTWSENVSYFRLTSARSTIMAP